MDDDVVDEPYRKLQDLPVEIEDSILSAGPSAESQIARIYPLRAARRALGKRCCSAFQPIGFRRDVPVPEVCFGRPRVSAQEKASAVEHRSLLRYGFLHGSSGFTNNL